MKCPKCDKDLVEWPHETGGYKGVQCFKCKLQWWSNIFDKEATRNEVRALVTTLKYLPFPEDAIAEEDPAIERECISLVAAFFNNDKLKIDYWWTASNPSFGGASPTDMINFGRASKLLKWIKARLEENKG